MPLSEGYPKFEIKRGEMAKYLEDIHFNIYITLYIGSLHILFIPLLVCEASEAVM